MLKTLVLVSFRALSQSTSEIGQQIDSDKMKTKNSNYIEKKTGFTIPS